MLYFLQTAVSEEKYLEKALQSIYGIGPITAKSNCNNYGLIADAKGKDLRRLHRVYLKTKFDDCSFELGSDLQQKIKSKCLALIDNISYRGRRHKNGYPVRGQRTHTNAKTQKALYKRWSTTTNETNLKNLGKTKKTKKK